MGENFWTSLDSNIPLTIGGVEVPAGYYYLAVKRSADGSKWSLAFIEPVETRSKGLDPFEVATRPTQVPVLFDAPLHVRITGRYTRALGDRAERRASRYRVGIVLTVRAGRDFASLALPVTHTNSVRTFLGLS